MKTRILFLSFSCLLFDKLDWNLKGWSSVLSIQLIWFFPCLYHILPYWVLIKAYYKGKCMCKIFATRGPQHQNKMKKLIVIKQSQCSNFKELSSCRFLCHGEGDWTLAILKFQIPRCSLDIALQSHYMACIHVHSQFDQHYVFQKP